MVTPAEVPPADESSANLVLDASSSRAEPVRVAVTFDDVVVAVQEGFPVQVEVWQEQPVYG